MDNINVKLDVDAVEVLKIAKDTETIKEIDGTLSLIIRGFRSVLLPFEIWTMQKEYNRKVIKEKLNENLKKVSKDDIVKPEMYIAKPILDNIEYCIDCDEIREMYSNLLAKSMYIFTKQMVHPSYIDLIRNLSPDEAKMLTVIYDNYIPTFSIRFLETIKNKFRDRTKPLFNYYLELNIHNKECIFKKYEDLRLLDNFQDDIGLTIYEHLVDVDLFNSCHVIENIDFYIDNLERLKLIETIYTRRLPKEIYHEIIAKNSFVKNVMSKIDITSVYNDSIYLGVKIGYIKFTNYGKSFYELCCKKIY